MIESPTAGSVKLVFAFCLQDDNLALLARDATDLAAAQSVAESRGRAMATEPYADSGEDAAFRDRTVTVPLHLAIEVVREMLARSVQIASIWTCEADDSTPVVEQLTALGTANGFDVS